MGAVVPRPYVRIHLGLDHHVMSNGMAPIGQRV